MTAGFFALAGVALLWLLQNITGRIDRRHESRIQKREAALEVYEELDAVMAANHKALSLAMRLTQANPKVAEGEFAAVHLGRLRGLLAIHFPACMPIFKLYDDQVAEHGKFLRDNLKGPDGKLVSAKDISGASFGYSMLVNTQTTKLLTDVRQFMDDRAKDLA